MVYALSECAPPSHLFFFLVFLLGINGIDNGNELIQGHPNLNL